MLVSSGRNSSLSRWIRKESFNWHQTSATPPPIAAFCVRGRRPLSSTLSLLVEFKSCWCEFHIMRQLIHEKQLMTTAPSFPHLSDDLTAEQITLKVTLSSGIIPGIWKIASLVPPHKGGDPCDLDNYRTLTATTLVMNSNLTALDRRKHCAAISSELRLLTH